MSERGDMGYGLGSPSW